MKYGWAGGALGPEVFQGQPEANDHIWTRSSQKSLRLPPKESTFSIIVPSMGQMDLLECLLGSLDRMGHRSYEVCIGYDATASERPDTSLRWGVVRSLSSTTSIKSAYAVTPGMSAAVNAAFSISTGEWIIWVCDDMVFLPGWDGFEFGLRRDRALCFQLLEPFSTPHFPPSCWAGDGPATFDYRTAWQESMARFLMAFPDGRTMPGHFFGTALFHRSKWVPWPTWPGLEPYSSNDISWFYEMYLTNPDLAFGRMGGNSLYHFVRASVKRAGITAPKDTGERFLRRYGLSIQDAYNLIDARSEALW